MDETSRGRPRRCRLARLESLLDIEKVRLLYGGLLAAVLWEALDGARVTGWLLLVLAVSCCFPPAMRRSNCSWP